MLGNRQKFLGESEIFSPTISHPANRAIMVTAARNGQKVFVDISTPCVHAKDGENIYTFASRGLPCPGVMQLLLKP